MDPESQGYRESSPIDILGIVKRQMWLMLLFVAFGVAFGWLRSAITEPVYRSTTRIVLDTPKVGSSNPQNSIDLPITSPDISTQIELLKSQRLLYDAMNDSGDLMNLRTDMPEVNAYQLGSTNAIQIEVKSKDPKLAESVAKALPVTYGLYDVDRRKKAVVSSVEWTKGRLDDERGKLKKLMNELSRLRQARAITTSQDEADLWTEKITNAERHLQETREATIVAKDRLRFYEGLRIPSTVQVPVEQRLRDRLAEQRILIQRLKADRKKLLYHLMEDHPEVRAIDAQIAEEQEYLKKIPKEEAATITEHNPDYDKQRALLADARATVKSAEGQENEAASALDRAKKGYKAYVLRVRPYETDLEERVAQSQEIVGTLTASLDQFRLKRSSQTSPVAVIMEPTPAEKTEPDANKNLMTGLMIGVVLAAAVAYQKDKLDDKLNTIDEAHQIAGVGAIGEIPLARNTVPALTSGAPAVLARDQYQVLRFNVQYSSRNAPTNSLMVTSTSLGEGKTDVACNLAVAMGANNRKVILVDTCINQPDVHSNMDVNVKPGLTEVLSGEIGLDECVQATPFPGLWVLSAGRQVANSTEVLHSEKMRELHEELKSKYDVVIFDTPACHAGPDAQVVASFVDGVLYVAQLGKTKKTKMKQAVHLLRQMDARLVGVVFTDRKKRPKALPAA